jgi:hypothetical protein
MVLTIDTGSFALGGLTVVVVYALIDYVALKLKANKKKKV